MLPFTRREIEKAWRQNLKVSEVENRENPQRLLLFYAVECGLKAVIMKRENSTRTDDCDSLSQFGHNINALLDHLRAGEELRLSKEVSMRQIKDPTTQRPVKSKEFNQMWRYGGETENKPSDADVEKQLLEIVKWIKKEL
jgi:hypothetical protein